MQRGKNSLTYNTAAYYMSTDGFITDGY